MSLPDVTRKYVESRLTEYCHKKVPAHLNDQIKVSFKIRGNFVTLCEHRPSFFDQSEWIDMVVAQFRYDPKTMEWTLFCADRNSRWHEYYDLEPNRNLDVLLKEVDDDPTGIFWG